MSSPPDYYNEGLLRHEPPIFESKHDDVPAHFEIPNENGYFPAGASDEKEIASCPATLYQMHPKYREKLDKPLASGTLILRDPAPGTANEVAIVGECEGVSFYVMSDDATTRTSETEFMLMLPEDCIMFDLENADPEMILHIENLLSVRTKFHDETKRKDTSITYPENLPNDMISRAIYRTSKMMSRLIVGASEKAAKGIDDYGEKKRESITETKEKKVGKGSIKAAKATRSVSLKTHQLSVKVTDKISDVVGGKVGQAVAIKEGDSAGKKKARRLLLASSIAYEEVAGGASEGYELMVKSAQSQAVSYVAKKHGEDAAELARHTAGAAANFGRAALTARRVVNLKAVAKSAGKRMVKDAVKQSLKG